MVVPDFFYGEPLDREKHNVQTWLKDHGAVSLILCELNFKEHEGIPE